MPNDVEYLEVESLVVEKIYIFQVEMLPNPRNDAATAEKDHFYVPISILIRGHFMGTCAPLLMKAYK